MFNLGEILRDKVTGFEGVVMGRTEYFTDCTHYGLASQQLHNGKPIGWEWFDETRLERVKNKEPIKKTKRSPTSGIYPNAPEM